MDGAMAGLSGTDPTLFPTRRRDRNGVPGRGQGFSQTMEKMGINPVVVGQQKAHPRMANQPHIWRNRKQNGKPHQGPIRQLTPPRVSDCRDRSRWGESRVLLSPKSCLKMFDLFFD